MPPAVDLRRPAAALTFLALACGPGTITPPGNSGGAPPGPANRPPVVTVPPSATIAPVPEGGSTILSVTADDPDGDALGYAWTQTEPATPQGTFGSRTVRNPTWTAPAVTVDTVFTFQVSITDGQGGSLVQTFQLTVTHLDVNRPPTVSAITVSPAMPVAGDVVKLSITATDPDGDPLTITWTQPAPSTQGTFGTPTQPSTTWISPPLGVASLNFSLKVTVSDGKATSQEKTLTLTVKLPAYGTDIQPIWNARCTSCHPSDGQLDLRSASSYGQLVNVVQAGGGACAGQKRVDPASAASSSLLGWLTGACGTPMPPAGPLSAGEQVKVQSWVLGGAAP